MTPELQLRVMTRSDCETARGWRNDALLGLRTPFPLTVEMQEAFYDGVICDHRARHRYWAAAFSNPPSEMSDLAGMVGLTDIQWENGLAEISLIVGPNFHRNGVGAAVVKLVLAEAFLRLRLETVCGEVYLCNPAGIFWQRMTETFHGEIVTLPRRKFWDGQLWNSLYFSISRQQWAESLAW